MRFWDSSALVAVCVEEPNTSSVRRMLRDDPGVVAWWGSPVECWSAFTRLRREGVISPEGEEDARRVLDRLGGSWTEILPSGELRRDAGRLVRIHPLRAGDALQLAAALTWASSPLAGEIVAFDERLRDAARLEGLTPVP